MHEIKTNLPRLTSLQMVNASFDRIDELCALKVQLAEKAYQLQLLYAEKVVAAAQCDPQAAAQ